MATIKNESQTLITDFTLVGLSENPVVKFFLFYLFFAMYIITLGGNLAIILAYKFSPTLHNPMYFFLTNFSILEMFYSSSTAPKLLSDLLYNHSTISFYGCTSQLCCVLLLAGTEFYILAAMAYDRYNAICHPLFYTVIMTNIKCHQLVAGSWIISAVNALIHTSFTFSVPFCGSHTINSFFCDVPVLLKLACKDTWLNELIVFIFGGGMTVTSLILIVISYAKIIKTILNIPSTSGRKKAFSTCTSHLIVVSIFYGSVLFMYLRPRSSYGKDEDKLISVMYTIIPPLLNPFIYSLRNKEVKIAMSTILDRLLAPLKH